MDIISGLAAASQALDIAKRIKDINDGLKDAELKLQIAELYEKLADVKIAFADAKIALQEKDAEINGLKAHTLNTIPTKRFGAYEFGIKEDGSLFDLPFCPNCIQTSGKQISITRGVGGHNLCPACKAVYNARETNAPR